MKDKKIKSFTVLLVAAAVFVLSAGPVWASTESNDDGEADGLKIVVTSLEITDKALDLSYEIRNDSDRDIWICDDVGFGNSYYNSELYLAEDNQTLILRRRLDLPSSLYKDWFEPPRGKYIRLCAGMRRYQSLSVAVPIKYHVIFGTGRITPFPQELVYAQKLAIEIGYYEGNLPDMLFNINWQKENSSRQEAISEQSEHMYSNSILDYLGVNELLKQRDEEIIIPYTYQRFTGEKVLSTTIDNLHIPFSQKELLSIKDTKRLSSPSWVSDLKSCTKIEINYKPSIIQYFFPYKSQQSLLSPDEIEYLQSQQNFVIEDLNIIRSFVNELAKITPFNGIFRMDRIANLDCYCNNEHLTSFTLYDNRIIETVEKQQLRCHSNLLNIDMFTPKILQIEYRIQCAANLKNLYYSN